MKPPLIILLSLLIVGVVGALSCASSNDAVERGNEFFDAGHYDEAIAEYTKAIEIDSENALAYYNRGVAYSRKDEYDKAIESYDKAINLAPDYADAYFNRGSAYYIQDRYERAIADFNEYISLIPDDADAYILRGNAHLANERNFDSGVERAMADYDKAIVLAPDYALIYNNRGNAYLRKNYYGRAIEDYDKALSLDPEFALAHDNRELAYEQMSQYESAISDYDKAIAVQPDTAYLYYGRGYIHVKLGNDTAARQDFLKALDLGFNKAMIESALTNEPISAKYRSHSPEAHQQGLDLHTRALSRLAQADYDNAVADTDKARKLIDPQLIHLYTDDMHQVYYQSAIAYYDTGLYDDAIRLFDKAIDVVASPSDYPDAYYWRGMSHYRKGSDRRAIADFDMLIGMERDYPDAAHYRELARKRLGE